MDNNSDYQKYIEEGYTEAGELVIRVEDITRMNLSEDELKRLSSKYAGRQDKAVIVIDKQGRTKKITSLSFGYNKANIQLADGTYAYSEDILSAIKDAISRLDSGSIIVDKKGKFLDPVSLMETIKETYGMVKIGDRVAEVKNVEVRRWAVQGAESDVVHNKGVTRLGNQGIQLPTGDYISLDEFLKALNDYVVLVPSKKEEVQKSELMEESKHESKVVRLSRKYKDKLARWLAAAGVMIVLATGIKITDREVKDVEPIVITQMFDQLDYEVFSSMSEEEFKEFIKKQIVQILEKYHVGATVILEDGDKLYSKGNLTGKETVIGRGLRQAGEYQISGVSILHNGQTIDFYVDTSIQKSGFDTGQFVIDECAKRNINLADIQISLHIGNEANNTRTGWMDIRNFINEQEISEESMINEAREASKYKDVVDNFNGKSITVNTSNGRVTIPVVDTNGNLLESGTHVIGSDGKEYIIGNLKLDSKEKMSYGSTSLQPESHAKKIMFSIEDCSLTLAALPLLGAIASTVATKKKNAEAQKNPTILEFGSEKEYEKFKSDFVKAKEEYEKKSDFKKAMKRIFCRSEVDMLQNLTQEQVQQLYSEIMKYRGTDLYYRPESVSFQNGRVIVKFQGGTTRDVTEEVMPLIASIGQENKVVAEGLLDNPEEEKSNGVRR